MENKVKILIFILVIIALVLIVYFVKFRENETTDSSENKTPDPSSFHGIDLETLDTWQQSQKASWKDDHTKKDDAMQKVEKSNQDPISAELMESSMPMFNKEGEISIVPFKRIADVAKLYSDMALELVGTEIEALETRLGEDHLQPIQNAINVLNSTDLVTLKHFSDPDNEAVKALTATLPNAGLLEDYHKAEKLDQIAADLATTAGDSAEALAAANTAAAEAARAHRVLDGEGKPGGRGLAGVHDLAMQNYNELEELRYVLLGSKYKQWAIMDYRMHLHNQYGVMFRGGQYDMSLCQGGSGQCKGTKIYNSIMFSPPT